MLLLILIILAMFAIYIGFCVESNPYSFLGKVKQNTVNTIIKLSLSNKIMFIIYFSVTLSLAYLFSIAI